MKKVPILHLYFATVKNLDPSFWKRYPIIEVLPLFTELKRKIVPIFRDVTIKKPPRVAHHTGNFMIGSPPGTLLFRSPEGGPEIYL